MLIRFKGFKTLAVAALMIQASTVFGHSDRGSDGEADRVEHFEGKPAHSLAQAFQNLEEGNQALAQLLKMPITAETSYEIHQLTYTLENALERIDDEMARLEDALETVHLASEANRAKRLERHGQQHLELARQLFDSSHRQSAP